MINERATEVLESIGLNKNETSIYLDLVGYPLSGALDISKRTGIHRSNVYDSLRSLIEKGLVKKEILQKKSVFEAVPPSKIKEYFRQKQQELEVILPELKRIPYENNDNENRISITEGKFALREAATELLEFNSPILTYGASKENVEAFGEGFLKEFHKKRVKKGIPMKHIYNADTIDRINFLNSLPLTEARFLNNNYSTNVCTTICGDEVLLFIFGKSIVIITIRNKQIADTYLRYFELLWRAAKKPQNE
jgi:sugar-specific transcriptional regulator TrmB